MATRDASGNFSLSGYNPTAATTIEVSWATGWLADVGTEITDSLSRDGNGGMRAALECYAGTKALPGMSFGDEPSSGLYWASAGDIRFSRLNVDLLKFTDATVTVTGAVTASGAGSFAALTASGTLTVNTGTWDTGGIDIASGDTYAIGGANVFDDATTLTATVVDSSLTSLGTIASLVATTADINNGTVDAVIGGTEPKAGTFTTLEATGASTLTGATTFGAEIVEAVGAVGSGLTPELDPADGTIQTWTLAAGESEPTEVMVTGEFITLHITSGGNTVAWTHVDKWIGGATPTLTNTAGSVDIVELWKVGTDVFGAHVGVASAAS